MGELGWRQHWKPSWLVQRWGDAVGHDSAGYTGNVISGKNGMRAGGAPVKVKVVKVAVAS
jgi:hypothetical protein